MTLREQVDNLDDRLTNLAKRMADRDDWANNIEKRLSMISKRFAAIEKELGVEYQFQNVPMQEKEKGK